MFARIHQPQRIARLTPTGADTVGACVGALSASPICSGAWARLGLLGLGTGTVCCRGRAVAFRQVGRALPAKKHLHVPAGSTRLTLTIRRRPDARGPSIGWDRRRLLDLPRRSAHLSTGTHGIRAAGAAR